MPDTLSPLSHATLDALSPVRHDLYALALALANRPTAAEGLLQKAVHEAFAPALAGAVVDVPAATRVALLAGKPVPTEIPNEPMPADTWARITAALQIQASKVASTSPRVLNPDSVLLNPDPLLAPKKPAHDDLLDGLGMSPTSRWVTAAIVALVLAATITIILTTRHSKPPAKPTTAPTTESLPHA